MSVDASVDVLIVGAGVGGAALALAISARSEARVLVCDRRGGPGNINRGDSLLPAVTRHLADWGAMPAVMAAGARPVDRMQVFDGARGQVFAAPLPATGAPYVVLPHPEIERALVETARARSHVRVCYGYKLTTLERAAGRVVGATLQVHGGATLQVRARVVVGADGATSTVRGALGISLPLTEYAHSFYITEVARPRGYEDAMRVELHADGGVLVVPIDERRVGLGVLVFPEQEALFRAGSLADKMAAIGRRSPLLAGPLPFPQGAHLYRLHRGHAASYVDFNVALIGDAIHVTNPTAGQGMTMAIEDAEALARHLIPALRGGAVEIDAALAAYERERWPRNAAQIRWSHWLSRLYAARGRAAERARTAVFRLADSPPGRRLQGWIWSRLAARRV